MKRINSKYLLIFLIALCHLSAYCQTNNDALKGIVAKLKDFSSAHVSEKAYLQFDKPYYAAGDTIYFKAYLTLGEKHQLSDLSRTLHVDLINTRNKIDRSIKLQIIDGVAWGDFALPDSLPKGNYRVRAYTNWMRNEGDEAYFNQTIPVGSTLNNKIPESSTAHKIAVNTQPDLQFFPEGGEMVTGIPSKIAFKAIGTNGLGIGVNGVIIDNTGAEVSKFTAAHLGMGYFYLKPETGKTYKAKVTYPNGTQNTVDLPQVNPKGITLKINNDSLDKASLQIISNENYFAENHDKTISLLIYNGGLATMVTVRLDSSAVNLGILKRHLRPGITKVTIFSATGEPLSERLLFVQNPDQLSLKISTDKTVYSKREKVHLGINALNRADSAIIGHFSVSVTDGNLVPVDENAETTISNYLLLTSDLKGYIEQPNYYFTNINDETGANLDLVMLTHGYRRFEWRKLLNEGYPPPAYQPEKSLEISGIAKSGFGKPLTRGMVSLISLHGGPLLSSKTDDKGVFHFSNLLFTDSAKFVLQAVNARGKNNTQLVYNEDKQAPVIAIQIPAGQDDINRFMQAYLENNEQQEQLNKLRRDRVLKEVKIRAIKRNDNYRSSSLLGPGHADQVIHADQLDKIGGPLSNKLAGAFHGAIGFKLTEGILPGLVIVDGIHMGRNFRLDDINGQDVETVELLEFASASIYGVEGGHGVMVITTKVGGSDSKDISSFGILPISAMGYYKAREFYSPKYQSPPQASNHRDLRSTIYWKPELVTDKDGKASFDFYNADGAGTYRLVIEGMDEKGDIGRTVYRYKVE